MPNFTVRLWGNDTLDFAVPYVRDAMAARAWHRVADYQRLVALERFGGVYLDTDVEIVKTFEPLLRHQCFVGFQLEEHESDLVNNAVIGASPGHWFVREARRRLEALNGAEETGSFSGPGLLTDILRSRGLAGYRAEGCDVEGVFVCPKSYFYPYSWEETYTPSVVTPDTFAVHHWENSWNPAGLRERVTRKVAARLARLSPMMASLLSATFRASASRAAKRQGAT